MSVLGIVKSKLYQRYKAYIFIKDWILISIVLNVLIALAYGFWCFVVWNNWPWIYYENYLFGGGFSIVRLSLGLSFALTVYFFRDSYQDTKNSLGLQ